MTETAACLHLLLLIIFQLFRHLPPLIVLVSDSFACSLNASACMPTIKIEVLLYFSRYYYCKIKNVYFGIFKNVSFVWKVGTVNLLQYSTI